jgi:hypothetical protein
VITGLRFIHPQRDRYDADAKYRRWIDGVFSALDYYRERQDQIWSAARPALQICMCHWAPGSIENVGQSKLKLRVLEDHLPLTQRQLYEAREAARPSAFTRSMPRHDPLMALAENEERTRAELAADLEKIVFLEYDPLQLPVPFYHFNSLTLPLPPFLQERDRSAKIPNCWFGFLRPQARR